MQYVFNMYNKNKLINCNIEFCIIVFNINIKFIFDYFLIIVIFLYYCNNMSKILNEYKF